MFADRAGRVEPGNRGELTCPCSLEVVGEGRDVLELAVLPDRVEVRQRIPDAGRRYSLRDGFADHRVVLAVGFGAAEYVVAPAHVVLVQEVREIRPRVVRPTRPLGRVRALERVDAAQRIADTGAPRRPLGDHEEMRGQAPGSIRFEHVVLEDEVACVGPVVRDVAAVVVPHDVGVRRALRADRVVRVLLAALVARELCLADETVHLAVVDVRDRVRLAVRPA